MVREIGTYREGVELFAPELADQYPSMRDSFSTEPVEDADRLIDFILHAGILDIGTTAEARDVFTGEGTGIRDNLRTDGVYAWGTDLAYYIKKYNLRLPDDFVKHALAK